MSPETARQTSCLFQWWNHLPGQRLALPRLWRTPAHDRRDPGRIRFSLGIAMRESTACHHGFHHGYDDGMARPGMRPNLPAGHGRRESAVAFTAGSDASATSQPTTDGGCPAGFTACGRGAATRCYDLSRAVDHCGQCGNACAPGIACQSSRCQQYQCQGALTFNALPAIPTLYKDTADSPPHFAFPAARTAISSSVTSTTTPNWISSILARVAGRSC